MATLKELRDVRIEKLNKIKELGLNPFPGHSTKEFKNLEITSDYENFENKKVSLTGRIMSWREHGHLVFADIEDFSGRIQVYIHDEDLAETDSKNNNLGFSDLNLLDLGDFIEVKGKITKTKTGQISIQPKTLRLLSKSLRPLPDKHDGLKDKETRLRRRYIEMAINPEVRELFVRKAKFWESTRDYLTSQGFIEINIPVLEHVTGGADANPFVTHMDAIDQDFYLRISQELYLKRLIGGGYEKVFEIGPRFRNEGISDEHLPEHHAIEWYWAYADYRDNMKLSRDLFRYIAKEVYDTTKFTKNEHTFDLADDWKELDYTTLIKKELGIDIFEDSEEDMIKVLKEKKAYVSSATNRNRLVDSLWKVLRKDISGPAFLINVPKFMSPLAKELPEDPGLTERFQIILAGSELANAYTELNDPIDQLERFMEQQSQRDAGDAEAQMLDIDYVEMLEYGMPPTSGYGHTERLFWFFEDVTAREGTAFPHMKYKLDEVTKEIYGLNDHPEAKPLEISDDISGLPSREEALELLEKHVSDDYQKLHSKMVAAGLESYASEFGEDKDLWYITGLLHDLDYFEHPENHPKESLKWFAEWGYPEALSHAVEAHYWKMTGVEPATKLAAALIAVDELAGFLYAYSLMRPTGWEGMKAKSVKKKFKDKGFAAKIDRTDIEYGIKKLGVDFSDHVAKLIELYSNFEFQI